MWNKISDFPNKNESKEFSHEICESSYTLENNFTEAKIAGEILNSDVRLHKTYFWIVPPNSKQPGQVDCKT